MQAATHLEEDQRAPRGPRWHLLISTLVVMAGLVVTEVLTLHLQEGNHQQVETRFQQNALEHIALVNERLTARQRELDSVRRLFESSTHITPAEFLHFTRPLLQEHLAIYQAALLRLDPGRSSEQLGAFLAEARRLLGQPVALLRPDTQGEYQALEPGDRHFPLLLQSTLCQPLPPGLDLGFPGPLRQALDQVLQQNSRRSGSLLALDCRDGQPRTGLVLGAALYSPAQDARAPPLGAILSVVDLRQLLAPRPLDSRPEQELSISLVPAGGQEPTLRFGPDPVQDERLVVAQPLGGPDSRYQLVIRPGSLFIEQNPQPASWHTQLPGLLFSLLLGLLLYNLLHQRHHALYLVARRTFELQESQQQLHLSEERWNLALDSAGDGVWDWDMATDTLYLSPMWKRMLGYQDAQIGTSPDEWRNRVHPEDILHCRHRLRDHLRGVLPDYACEHRLRCADGNWKWVICRGRVVLRDTDGKPLRLIGTLSDISRRKALELEVTSANQRLTALLGAASQVAIIAVSSDGRIETFNHGAERLLGYGQDEMQDRPGRLVLPAAGENMLAYFDQQLHGCQNCELETSLRNALHQDIPVTLMLSRIEGDGYLLVAIDLSARKQAQAALQERSNLLVRLGAQVPGVIFQLRLFRDGHLSMPWASTGLQTHFNLSAAQVEADANQLIGRIHAEDRTAVLESLHQSARQLCRWQRDFRVQIPGRPVRWMHGEAVPEEQPDGAVQWHGYLTDISELKRVESELRTLTITDSLTGIHNRRHFREQLELELARHARGHGELALIMLDIDHFKQINDRFGHDVGDLVLKEMCRRINGLLRRVDLFCRLGGEEFAVLCPQTDLAHAHQLAERLRHSLQDRPFEPAGRVTASFGVSGVRTGDSADLLLQRCDRALYAAKTGGRNRVCDESRPPQGSCVLTR